MEIRNGLSPSMDVYAANSPLPSGEVGRSHGVGNTVGTSAADSADLSGTAQLAEAALTLPDVRIDKVSAVQMAINDGNYRVDASVVAKAIIDSMSGKK